MSAYDPITGEFDTLVGLNDAALSPCCCSYAPDSHTSECRERTQLRQIEAAYAKGRLTRNGSRPTQEQEG